MTERTPIDLSKLLILGIPAAAFFIPCVDQVADTPVVDPKPVTNVLPLEVEDRPQEKGEVEELKSEIDKIKKYVGGELIKPEQPKKQEAPPPKQTVVSPLPSEKPGWTGAVFVRHRRCCKTCDDIERQLLCYARTHGWTTGRRREGNAWVIAPTAFFNQASPKVYYYVNGEKTNEVDAWNRDIEVLFALHPRAKFYRTSEKQNTPPPTAPTPVPTTYTETIIQRPIYRWYYRYTPTVWPFPSQVQTCYT